MLLINLVSIYQSMHITDTLVVSSYENTLLLLARQLDKSLSNLKDIADTMLADIDVNAVNQAPPEKLPLWDYRSVLKRIRDAALSGDIRSNISIILFNRGRVLSSARGIDSIDHLEFIVHPENAAERNGNWRLVAGDDADKNDRLVYMNYPVGGSVRGTMAMVEIDREDIVDLLTDLQVSGGGAAFLFDTSGFCVFTDMSQSEDVTPLVREIAPSFNEGERFSFTRNGTRYRLICHRSSISDIALGMYYPESQIMAPIHNIRLWVYIAFPISLVTALFFIVSAHRNFIRPVHTLVRAMENVRDGDFSVRIEEKKTEELGFIYGQFNNMVEKTDMLIKDVYLARLSYQQAQLRFLQSQINPHFLFNCLNLIYQMSMARDFESASQMALCLGKYYRSALRSKRDIITLREEMESIEVFIKIQCMRFPEKLSYVVELNDDTLNALIPRLLIQPLVENAFLHGFEDMDRQGTVRVCGKKSDKGLILFVEDDGKGMSDEEMAALNQSLAAAGDEISGEGLANPNQRLKLRFGKDAGIELMHAEPSGMIVKVIIPDSGEA